MGCVFNNCISFIIQFELPQRFGTIKMYHRLLTRGPHFPNPAMLLVVPCLFDRLFPLLDALLGDGRSYIGYRCVCIIVLAFRIYVLRGVVRPSKLAYLNSICECMLFNTCSFVYSTFLITSLLNFCSNFHFFPSLPNLNQ